MPFIPLAGKRLTYQPTVKIGRVYFMVRRNNEPISGADKAKVRVFYAEVEGNNESVQEALKTMLAMSRPARVISEQKVNGNAAVLLQHADAEVVEEPSDQVERN